MLVIDPQKVYDDVMFTRNSPQGTGYPCSRLLKGVTVTG